MRRARLEAFYDLWTLKESCMKAAGKGLYLEPAGFELEWPGETVTLADCGLPGNYHFFRFEFTSGYKVAACGTETEAEQQVRQLDVVWV